MFFLYYKPITFITNKTKKRLQMITEKTTLNLDIEFTHVENSVEWTITDKDTNESIEGEDSDIGDARSSVLSAISELL